jgi:hypothetical protein
MMGQGFDGALCHHFRRVDPSFKLSRITTELTVHLTGLRELRSQSGYLLTRAGTIASEDSLGCSCETH